MLEDSLGGKLHKTLLYKLSENKVLNYFKKIVLVSSVKDQYIATHSARIQVSLVQYRLHCYNIVVIYYLKVSDKYFKMEVITHAVIKYITYHS